MMQDILIKLVSEAVVSLGLPATNFTISHPGVEAHGDYAANVALQVQSTKSEVRSIKQNPREIAQAIVDRLNKNEKLKEIVSKIEIAGPGFINFWITQSALIDSMREQATTDTFLKLEVNKGKKVMVEFAHPNTHKTFHIGHLRNITTGEAIVRMLEALGTKIIRGNYEGDVGLHVAKCLYGIMKWSKTKKIQTSIVEVLEKELQTVNDRVTFLGTTYVEGNKAYENDGQAKSEILKINKMIYAKDSAIYDLWKETRQWSLDYFETIYSRVSSHFDRYYFESEVWERGKELVLENLKKGIFQESQGAIIFPGDKFGLHARVFITKEGNATYEGKDMGLGELQFKEHDPDLIIHCVAPEQAGYFQVVFEALGQIFPGMKEKEKHLVYGFVRLKEGKMSSRTGNVILGEWLLNEAKQRIRDIVEQAAEKSKSVDAEAIAEKAAAAAVKYSFLKVALSSDITFDFKESIAFDGNSGPYLQYTYARAKSVLRKSKIPARNRYAQALAGGQNPKFQINPKSLPAIATLKRWQAGKIQSSKLTPEELSILRALHRFPEVVLEAGTNLAPNLICNYLFDLAQKYNLFYQKIPILNAPDEKKQFRLLLTQAVAHVLKNGLYLLGIDVLEEM